MVALAQGCDWTCEPWIVFDGELTAVTAAAAGAPVGWRLNGDTVVLRSFTSQSIILKFLPRDIPTFQSVLVMGVKALRSS